MVSPLHGRGPSTTWRLALIGALASLPLIVVLNWLPNSEATVGGGIVIFGALLAGAIAAIRSTDPGAAGFRAGLLGGVLAVFTLVVTVASRAVGGPTGAWSLSRVAFWVVASAVGLSVASVFGLVCGRVGGWLADTAVSRWPTGANGS